MNDSNNIVDNNNSAIPTQTNNNSNVNVNSMPLPNEPLQPKQNISPMQPQEILANPNEPVAINNNVANVNFTSLANESLQPNQNVSPIQSQQNPTIDVNNSSNVNPFPNNNSTTVNSNSVNQQESIQQNGNSNNITQSNDSNDDELLKAFIGNNYNKITTRRFNIPGFFFTSFYMFYRKMFLYGILVFIVDLIIINLIKNSLIMSILIGIVVGLFVNKLYLYYAKKKINKIKLENSQKSIDELKNICTIKGGTSVGKIFLGFLTEIGIALVITIFMFIIGFGSFVGSFFNSDFWNMASEKHKINNPSSLKE